MPKSANALIIVETPFQLLCASEYISITGCSYRLIVRESGVGRNDEQMHAMLAGLGLSPTILQMVKPKSRVDLLKFVGRTLLLCFQCSKLVIGSYGSGVQRLFQKIFSWDEIVLLDDGVATLLFHPEIKEKHRGIFSLFSIFDIDDDAYKKRMINDFSSLKGSAKKTLSGNGAGPRYVFIGQDLVEAGIVDRSSYISAVKEVVNIIPAGESLYYVPHRAEKINGPESMFSDLGIILLPIDSSIEYFALRNGWSPIAVYSFISTALFTMSKIFPRTKFYSIQSRTVDVACYDHYENIMSHLLRCENLTLLPLGESDRR